MSKLKERLDLLREEIQKDDFLDGKGLSNEVNIRIFCYNAAEELTVTHFLNQLRTDPSLRCHLIECNLYKTFLSICDDLDITDAIPEMEESEGSDFLLEQCKPEEVHALIEINRASLDFFHHLPVSERDRYSVSYNYHIRAPRVGEWRLVHHKRTPLALSDAGELWLILCSVDWAPDDSELRATVTSEISSKVWYYDMNTMSWNESAQENLTDLEKAVLVLSNRGLTMNEIADTIFKSVDSVKGYRKSLFAKLGVSNITEAIACAKARKLV